MTNSRNKGAAFEREVAKLIKDNLGFTVKRHLDQYREKDLGDLIGLNGWTIECKRYACGTQHRAEWWQQVKTAASKLNTCPVLIYKFDRSPIRCVVELKALADNFKNCEDVCEVSFETWCLIVRERICSEG